MIKCFIFQTNDDTFLHIVRNINYTLADPWLILNTHWILNSTICTQARDTTSKGLTWYLFISRSSGTISAIFRKTQWCVSQTLRFAKVSVGETRWPWHDRNAKSGKTHGQIVQWYKTQWWINSRPQEGRKSKLHTSSNQETGK